MKDQDLGKVLGVLPRLAKEIRGSFAPEAGYAINRTEFAALMEIGRNPRQPMKHYMHAVGLESGSFTYIADALESKGLIRRAAGQDDKRKTVLEMTQLGQRVTGELRREFDRYVAEKLACLSDEERRELVNAVAVLEGILDKLERQHG